MKFVGFIFSFLAMLTPTIGQAARYHHSSSDPYDLLEEVDYVIVGAGTSGCPLAAKLASQKKHGKYKNSVLILEAGVNLTQDPAVLASNILATLPLTFDPKYSNTTTPYQSPLVAFPYSDGQMWGGSSGHNGLQAYRGTPTMWDQWAILSNDPRWAYDALLENDMKPMEHYTPDGTPINLSQRGTRGPLFITQEPPISGDPFMQAVSTGTNAPLVDDLNDPDYGNVGIGANQDWVTPPYLGTNSIRSFAANAYLTGVPTFGIPPIIDENGFGLKGRRLRLLSNAVVSHIEFDERKRAKRVKYYLNGSKESVKTVRVKKEVILCTGTIQDAAILQRSGIGDPALLGSLGIPIIAANPNVGANLQNHYGPQALIGGARSTTELPEIGSGFIDLSPYMSAGERRYQLFMTNAAFFFPAGISSALGITTGNYVAGINVTPNSKGSIAIVSRSPFDDPRINFNQYSDGSFSTPGTDAYKAVAFYKIMQSVAAANGGQVLYPPQKDYDAGDAALFQDAVNTNFNTYHASGSCRMGTMPVNGVVNSRLQVFEVEGVRVASCAVAPVIEDGNTAYQAFVVGLEAARILGVKD